MNIVQDVVWISFVKFYVGTYFQFRLQAILIIPEQSNQISPRKFFSKDERLYNHSEHGFCYFLVNPNFSYISQNYFISLNQ